MSRMAAAAALVAASVLAGCGSSPSPKDRLLTTMHKTVPNVPSIAIVSDADQVCTRSAAAARSFLLSDSLAEEEGVDGLDLGSAALAQYATRLVRAVHATGYCKA